MVTRSTCHTPTRNRRSIRYDDHPIIANYRYPCLIRCPTSRIGRLWVGRFFQFRLAGKIAIEADSYLYVYPVNISLIIKRLKESLIKESLIKCSVDLFYELLYCYIVRKEEIKGHEST